MPRLGHKKSRNGCRQCKARHVKCDEQQPCGSCARHGVQCSLVTWDPNAPPPQPVRREASSSRPQKAIPDRSKSSAQSSAQTPAAPIDNVLNPSPGGTTPGDSESASPYSDAFPFLTKFASKSEVIQSSYWARDLELMHHWTIDAYWFLSDRDDVREVWRTQAPKEAVQHPFLMHEMLAFSALHLAFKHPQQRRAYYALGIHHQDLAIKQVSKALPTLSPENSGAMFATSAVISLSTFASTGLDALDPNTKSRPVMEDLMDIFALQQGMYSVLRQTHEHVQKGIFGVFLSDANVPLREAPILADIMSRLPALTSFIESQALTPDVSSEVLQHLSSLNGCLQYAMNPCSPTRELRFLFLWPIHHTSRFCAMLRQKESPALVVLAHYAVAFRTTDSFYWFLDGWGERIIEDIAEAIEPSWRPAIQWTWDTIMKTDQLPTPSQQAQHS